MANGATRAETSGSRDGRVTIIEPSGAWRGFGLRELWSGRHITYFLVWREVKARYKQTAMGAAWAFLQPLLPCIVFSVVMGRFAGLPSDGTPYPVFVFLALLPWQFFARSVSDGALSLIAFQSLVTKLYFPRVALPAASVVGAAFDMAVASLAAPCLMAWYGVRPGAAIVALPLFVLLLGATALAASVWLSALAARFRDVRNVVPVLVQVGAYASPVVYPARLVPERWRALYGLNPIAGVIEGFRWSLAGAAPPSWPMVCVGAVTALVALFSGLAFFRSIERTLADTI